MNEFDGFSIDLFEQAKRFYEKSKEAKAIDGQNAYNNASLLLGICALEAYVNGIAEEMCLVDRYSIQVRSALLEREIKLKNGQFILSNTLKMSRLIDRIEIIYYVHTLKSLPDDEVWCHDLKRAIDYRNQIVHPKTAFLIDIETLEKSLRAVNSCLSVLFKAVYKSKFPRDGTPLVSRLLF